MAISLKEIKNYLRVDFEDDDLLIATLLETAKKLVNNITRKQDINNDVALMYAVAYLYEHREKADHNDLTKTLRSLLFFDREEMF